MKRILCRSTVLGAALSAIAIVTQASPIEVTVDTAGVLGFVPLSYGVHTANAALGNGFEVDGYTFAGQTGDRIRVALSTLTAGLDPSLVLRGPGGATVIGSTSCSGSGFGGAPIRCSTVLDAALPSNGSYTLNLSEVGTDEGGDYVLHLDRYPPVDNWLGFGYGAPKPYALGHVNDSDYFAFSALAGSGARLTIGSQTAGLDPHVEVWNPAGQNVQSTSCSGSGFGGAPILCTVLIDLDFTTNGIFKVGVDDVGLDETGNYEIGITCLYGTCANTVPGVPELPAPLLMLSGTAAMMWALRRRRAH